MATGVHADKGGVGEGRKDSPCRFQLDISRLKDS